MKPKLNFDRIRIFKSKTFLVVLGLAVLVIGGYALTQILNSSRAATVGDGYGCGDYSFQNVDDQFFDTEYSLGCQRELVQNDIQFLNSDLTTGGISCNPSTTLINTTTTCTGTLLPDLLAPTDGLYLSVQGQTPVLCAFSGSVFTCSNMNVGPTKGTVNVFGAVGQTTTAEDIGIDITVLAPTDDTDGDGIDNEEEIENGTDPLDPNSTPTPRSGGLAIGAGIIAGAIAILSGIYVALKKGKGQVKIKPKK